MKTIVLQIVGLSAALLFGCDRRNPDDLQMIDVYGNHAVYIDPTTVRRDGDVVTALTVWGPQNADERFERGEMRRTVRMNCRNAHYYDQTDGFYVHNRKIVASKTPEPISSYATTAGYAKAFFDRLC